MALQHERVAAADRFEEPDEDLAVGEVEQGGGGQLDAEVVADLPAELRVGTAAEEHQPLVVCPGAASHQTPTFSVLPVLLSASVALVAPGFHQAGDHGELGKVVHALYLIGVCTLDGHHRVAVVGEHAHGIGEVFLALRVV